MEETPLEKIVVPCFGSVDKRYKEKFWHTNGKYVVIKNVSQYVALPWFCGSENYDDRDDKSDDKHKDDILFKKFLASPYYFYRCRHNGLQTEYVVTPYFYTLMPHDKSCENPMVCNHTFEYMVKFLMLSEEEQLAGIESLLRRDFYFDRLQFFKIAEKDETKHICTIASSPEIKLTANGDFGISSVVKYSSRRDNDEINKLNKKSSDCFKRLLALFQYNNVVRNDFVRQLGNKFGSILQHILRLEHNKKTNL